MDAKAERSLEKLDADACMGLLRTQPVGRIAVTGAHGFPLVYPVNYAIESGEIVFRTSQNMEHLLDHSIVTFEVDSFDPETRAGWSVMAHGSLVPHHEPGSFDAEGILPTTGAVPWAPGERKIWMRLVPEVVSGRRIAED